MPRRNVNKKVYVKTRTPTSEDLKPIDKTNFEPIIKTSKKYEHQHFGPHINVVACLPGWPVMYVAWAKLYLHHSTPTSALAQWLQLNGAMSCRTIFSTVRGSEGTIKTIDAMVPRFTNLIAQKSNPAKIKYNHIIFPDMKAFHKDHTYLPKDREMVRAIKNAVKTQFTGGYALQQIFFYETAIATDIDPDDTPVFSTNKNWWAWRLMLSFLNQLSWPMSRAYFEAKEEGWPLYDARYDKPLLP